MLRSVDINPLYYAIAVLIVIGIWIVKQRLSYALLIAYSFLVVSTTLLRRTIGESAYQLIPFWSYSDPKLRQQIIANILMFIPVGLFGANIWKWKAILLSMSFSAMIELTQLITKRGLFEFDDIIHNTLGAAIGVVFIMMISRVWRRLIQK